MKKKCIFIDVDGTLYHRHDEFISDMIIDKLKEASQKADLYISTGRSEIVLSLLGKSKDYFKGMIMANGAYIKLPNNQEKAHLLNPINLKQLVDSAKKNNATIALITRKEVYVSKLTEFVDWALTPRYDNLLIVLNGYDFDLSKEYVMGWIFDDAPLIDQVISQTEGFNVFKWGSQGADIMGQGITKAAGVKEVVALNKNARTYAVGDAANDIEMFRAVDVAICMQNGSEVAKKEADYITTEPSDEGFIEAIDYILKEGEEAWF